MTLAVFSWAAHGLLAEHKSLPVMDKDWASILIKNKHQTRRNQYLFIELSIDHIGGLFLNHPWFR